MKGRSFESEIFEFEKYYSVNSTFWIEPLLNSTFDPKNRLRKNPLNRAENE